MLPADIGYCRLTAQARHNLFQPRRDFQGVARQLRRDLNLFRPVAAGQRGGRQAGLVQRLQQQRSDMGHVIA